ncbi:MAG: hypothetical protein FJ255_01240 [Phycisphaerae bacterium]|nr:hypothetical protein [Phycisphaerae bacterium]
MTPTPGNSGDHRGVRPTQALCEKCGYQFGGIEIEPGGVIVCPECAHVTRFALRTPERRPARWAWLAAGVVLIMIWGVVRMARGDDPWLVAAVTLGFAAALIVVVWARGAAMGRRP